jgi:type IV secretory pathway VirB9-like protein
VLVKPTRADITTNLVITTDRRTYMLELRSGEKPYMPAVAWAYPQPPASQRRRSGNAGHSGRRRAQLSLWPDRRQSAVEAGRRL